MYTLPFLQNKKRELNIDFNTETNLRSFVESKLKNLSKYTTLPFFNQVEMVMNDLPVEISGLFIVNEKMTGTKSEILKYCETIQDLAEHFLKKTQLLPVLPIDNQIECDELNKSPSKTLEMEIFEYNESTSSYRGRSSGRSGNRGGKRGRVSKRGRVLKSIAEDEVSDESYSFLEQMDDSSRSSFSEC